MKNIFNKLFLVIAIFSLITSCTNTDDFTGDSTLNPSNPALGVALEFNNEESLVEDDIDYGFTVSISEPQIVDVSVKLSQTSGTAAKGEDFDFPNEIVIKAGTTSASGVISIFQDDIVEETEDAVIMIASGNEANVNQVSSQTVKFNILNYTEGDLAIHMDWATSQKVTDNFGNEIDATDFADMRLLLTNVPYTEIIDEADGGSFESLVLSSDLEDGEYYIVADFYDVMENPLVNLNINTAFDQAGVINNQSYSYASIIKNEGTCKNNYAILNKVIKNGNSWEITSVGQKNFTPTNWTSGFDVQDAFGPAEGYASKIVSNVDCDGRYFLGINKEWMQGTWGEEIVKEANVYYTIDADGNITIPSQFIFTTLYSGANYDYKISGTGKLDPSTNTVTLNYVLDQEGFSPSEWMFDNGYMAQDYFIAIVQP